MARKHHKSKSRPSRNCASPASEADPKTRGEIIENERMRLMKAHAILGCVQQAIESDGVCAGDRPYWPAAIEAAGELVNEAVRRLEDLEYAEGRETLAAGVREMAAAYDVAPLH
ncbi:hypothetical protein HNQ60_005115 [Povalibacter uvarum]|uniref:Uncharacterized protein n=1 Tax=Povalibacter uvarum TaxID=732238 RepID=A0A841HTR9_9GAMM|nr:hypothetical protein [Povalibacter uvarum]